MKTVWLKFLLFVFSVTFFGLLCADQTLGKIPIVVDPKIADHLTPEQYEIVQKIVKALQKMDHWENYSIDLPESKSLALVDGSFVKVGDLFIAPTDNEVRKLAYDDSHERIPLSADQVRQVKENATFEVASKDYPGQKHLWKLSIILQKGRKNIEITLEKDLANSLEYFVVSIPDDVKGMKKGITSLYDGLRGIVGVTFGLPEMTPIYNERDLDNVILPDVEKQAKLNALNENNNSNMPKEMRFDDRLFDSNVQAKALPHLERIQHLVDSVINEKRNAIEVAASQELRAQGMSLEQQRAMIEQYIKLEKDLLFEEAVQNDSELESLLPGFGKLLANERHALRISRDIEYSLQKKIERFVINEGEKYDQAHPILTQVSGFRDSYLLKVKESYYREIRWDYLQNIPEALRLEGLNQEAYLYETVLNFKKSEEAKIKKQLQSQVKEAQTFSYESPIWNSKNWKVTTEGSAENPDYRLQDTTTDEVTTRYPGWRLVNAYYMTKRTLISTPYYLMWTNLINGPYGLRTLVNFDDHFNPDKVLNSQTGKIVTSDNEVMTLRGKIKDSIETIRKSRENFEKAPDEGLLGKKYTRFLNRIWNYCFRGIIGIPLRVGTHIGITGANMVFSGAALVTAPIWAPLSTMVVMGFDAGIYDTHFAENSDVTGHHVHNALPFWFYLVGDVGFGGVGRTLVNGAEAVILHPAAGTIYAGYSELCKWTHTAYDSVALTLFKSIAKIPASDSWTAKRIAGPDISSTYFYQVKPEVAILGLQAMLESDELALFEQKSQEEIERPLTDYRRFFGGLVQFWGTINLNSEYNPNKILETETSGYLNRLNKLSRERRAEFSHLTDLRIRKDLIKQSEADLEISLSKGKEIVEDFFKKHIIPNYSSAKIEALWRTADVVTGDYDALTRYYFAKLFASEFLTPLEANDEIFIIPVADERLRDKLSEVVFPIKH